MGANRGWWIREECRQLLPVFLRQQQRLQELDLNQSNFTSEFSETLLTTIAQTPNLCAYLEDLGLETSLNFESDVTVNQFADIL